MQELNRIVVKIMLVLAAILVSPVALAMEKDIFNWWEIAACPEENIEVEGTVRFQSQDIGGGWVFQAFWSGQGWGHTSGTQYNLQGKWMEVAKETPPFIFIWNDHFQLIGKGNAPNYRLANKVKIIVDANGEVRVEFEESPWPCPAIDFDMWQ